MAIPIVAVGDKATAAWANAVAALLNALPAIIPAQFRLQATQTTGVGQALTNGAFTTITGYGTDVDTFGGGTLNVATGVWTCPTSGQYTISGQVSTTSGGTRLLVAVQKNAVAILAVYVTGTTVTNATAVFGPKEFTLAAGDAIQVVANVNAAAMTTVNTNGSTSFLRIERVS